MASIGSLTADLRLESAQFIRELNRAAQETARNTNAMKRSMASLQAEARNVGRGFNQMRLLVAGYIGMNVVRNFVQTAEAMGRLRGQIMLVTSSQEEQAAMMQTIFEVAQRAMVPIDALGKTYARVALSGAKMGISARDAAALTETLAKAFTVSGSSSAEAGNGLIQFTQALSRGRPDRIEMRSFLTGMPALMREIEKISGLTADQITTQFSQGKINMGDFLKWIGQASGTIDEMFSKMPRTIGQALTQLNNQWMLTSSTTAEASGATAGFIEAIDRMKQVIASEGFIANLSSLANILAKMAENIDKVVIAGGVLAGLRLGSAFGVWGSAAGALAGGLGAYLLMTANAAKTTAELESRVTSLTSEINDLNEKLKTATGMQRVGLDTRLKALNEQLTAAQLELQKRSALAAAGGGGGMGDLNINTPPIVDEDAIEKQKKFADNLSLTLSQTRQLTEATYRGNAAYTELKDRLEATNDVMQQGIDVNSQLGKSLIQMGIDARQADRELQAAQESMSMIPELANQAGQQLASSFADAVVEAKDLNETLNELIKNLAKMALNAAFMRIIGSAGAGGEAGTGLLGTLLHSGGVGSRAGPKRLVPSAAFASAPRLHGGFMPGEFPAILKEGEGVFTPEQMRAMGGRVTINVINQGGANVSVGQERDDGNGGTEIDVMIDAVVARNMTRPGTSTYKAMKSMGGRLQGGRA